MNLSIKKQGEVTLDLLDAMGIKYYLLNKDSNNSTAKVIVGEAAKYMESNNEPVAIVVSKGTFEKYIRKDIRTESYELTREKAIDVLLNNIDENYLVVSTTGKTSRELFELREINGRNHNQDFFSCRFDGTCILNWSWYSHE